MRRHSEHGDAIQPAAEAALEKIGASTVSLVPVGNGCGDILVGWHGVNVLLELKSGNKPQRENQKKFEAGWNGQYAVAHSPEEAVTEVIRIATALDAVGKLREALGVKHEEEHR